MRLMGRFNWWAPAPLAQWWRRHGFHEAADMPVDRVTAELSAEAEAERTLVRTS